MANADDSLIRSLYAAATLEYGPDNRAQALGLCQEHVRAGAAAWLTEVKGDSANEFTVLPGAPAVDRKALSAAAAGVAELPALPGLPSPRLVVRHRAGNAISCIFGFWFADEDGAPPPERLDSLIGHLVAAHELQQRLFLQRDEWLLSLGRPNRGSGALVDGAGVIHSASEQFLSLMREEFDAFDGHTLPFALPDIELTDDNGLFSQGELRMRMRPHGTLFVLHARRSQALDELSPREQEIARALGRGKTFKSVAREKGIAVSTVANHASRIYRKLGIYRREDLVEIVRAPRGELSSQANGAY